MRSGKVSTGISGSVSKSRQPAVSACSRRNALFEASNLLFVRKTLTLFAMWLIIVLLGFPFLVFEAFGSSADYNITTSFENFRPGLEDIGFALRNDLGYAEVEDFQRIGIQPHSGKNLLYCFGGIVLVRPDDGTGGHSFKTISFWYYLPSPVDSLEVDYTDPHGGPFNNTAALVNNATPNTWQHLTVPLPGYVGNVLVKGGPDPRGSNFALDDLAFTVPEPRVSVLFLIGLGIFLLHSQKSRSR